MNTTAFETQDRRLEESLGSAETLITNGDNLTVRKLIGLFQAGALAGSLNLLLEVESDVAKLLLDITDDFSLGGSGEGVATLSQNLHKIVGKIATSHINTGNSVRKGETLVDRDNVSNTITRIEDDTSGTTGSVERKNGLDGDVEGRGVESLEHDLGHLLSVGLRIDGSLSKQNWMFLWGDTKLVVESMMPNLLRHHAQLDT